MTKRHETARRTNTLRAQLD